MPIIIVPDSVSSSSQRGGRATVSRSIIIAPSQSPLVSRWSILFWFHQIFPFLRARFHLADPIRFIYYSVALREMSHATPAQPSELFLPPLVSSVHTLHTDQFPLLNAAVVVLVNGVPMRMSIASPPPEPRALLITSRPPILKPRGAHNQ